MTALTINSAPTTLLKNTYAGITKFNISKHPIRVLAIRDNKGDGEHWELVFGNIDEKNIKDTSIQPNKIYRTLPKVA